jgi:hypothetical protein
MGDSIRLILVFGGVTLGIWISYRLFMRGDTYPERVASRLPPGFKADWSSRQGDTYVGYEKAGNRMVFVDYPHATVVAPGEVRSVEPVNESVLGLIHRWVEVTVARNPAQYRIWFRFSGSKRDEILARLKAQLDK